ncbi:MAG: hypothetical protein L6Q98_05370 [Anaerolineae bacterium]|nr:hypothetical protein [Anaerolineae bacterium]MCK6577518.1 hypothetical protein [Anaerolineae bacterium]NUQ03634.1 hypothetical protein [Anaerolineae bacterium]
MALANPRQNPLEIIDLPASVRRRGPVWRGYLIGQDEKRRINRMLTSALLDDALCARLVYDRDSSLLSSFGLSLETQQWLRGIQAESLEELAGEISLQL